MHCCLILVFAFSLHRAVIEFSLINVTFCVTELGRAFCLLCESKTTAIAPWYQIDSLEYSTKAGVKYKTLILSRHRNNMSRKSTASWECISFFCFKYLFACCTMVAHTEWFIYRILVPMTVAVEAPKKQQELSLSLSLSPVGFMLNLNGVPAQQGHSQL